MSIDFSIAFPAGAAPTAEQVRHVVEDYLGDVLRDVTAVKEEWWAFKLRGSPSFPFQRVVPEGERITFSRPDRFVEYCHATTSFIVRLADEFTIDVAANLARIVARFWKGTVME